MSFEILMGTFVFGIAAMLGIMGSRQWKMGYRIAGGLSLVTSALIVLAGIAIIAWLVW